MTLGSLLIQTLQKEDIDVSPLNASTLTLKNPATFSLYYFKKETAYIVTLRNYSHCMSITELNITTCRLMDHLHTVRLQACWFILVLQEELCRPIYHFSY